MDDRRLLRTIYRAVEWDDVFRTAPDATRAEADALFARLMAGLKRPESTVEPIPQAQATDDSDAAQAQSVSLPARVVLNCDGGSKGNPGPASIGMVLSSPEGTELRAWGKAIGRATNNVAEYRALIEGLKAALEGGAGEIEVRADSELLVRQMTGRYRVKNAGLKPLFSEAQNLLGRFRSHRIRHVPRARNARADALANRALEGRRS